MARMNAYHAPPPPHEGFTIARTQHVFIIAAPHDPAHAPWLRRGGAPAAMQKFLGHAAEPEPAIVDEMPVTVEASPEAPAAERPFRELVRRLTPDPGLWRLVRYADFIDTLMPQLAVPHRLQPGHQLACYVQLYELTTPAASHELESAARRELGAAGRLLPLSYDLCRRFALSLPRPTLAVTPPRANTPGHAPAGARFLTLRVALDPTVETTAPAPQAAQPEPSTPAPEPAPTNVSTQACPPAGAIPENFNRPWDQRLTRDEALYDMTLETTRGPVRRWLGALFNRVPARAMRRWYALLQGKSADEQLWGVRPPCGALGDARVRRWVERTLQLSGYELPKMLVEWEIHWRRRGE